MGNWSPGIYIRGDDRDYDAWANAIEKALYEYETSQRIIKAAYATGEQQATQTIRLDAAD